MPSIRRLPFNCLVVVAGGKPPLRVERDVRRDVYLAVAVALDARRRHALQHDELRRGEILHLFRRQLRADELPLLRLLRLRLDVPPADKRLAQQVAAEAANVRGVPRAEVEIRVERFPVSRYIVCDPPSIITTFV